MANALLVFNRNPYDGTGITWNGLRLAEQLLNNGLEDIQAKRIEHKQTFWVMGFCNKNWSENKETIGFEIYETPKESFVQEYSF